MKRLRLGRHNKQLVYVQHDVAPTNNDRLFAVFFNERDAAMVVEWSDFLTRELPEASEEGK